MPLLSLLGLPFRAIIAAPLKLSFGSEVRTPMRIFRGVGAGAGARVGQAWHCNQVVYGRVAATIFTGRPSVRLLEFMPQITTSRVV